MVGWRSRSLCVETRLMPARFLLSMLPLSEDDDEELEAVGMRSISLLGLS
jgi:hypothetical protein